MSTAIMEAPATPAVRFAIGRGSLGSVLVARSEQGVCAMLLGDDVESLTRELQLRFPDAIPLGDDPGMDRLVAWAVGLVEDPRKPVDLPLDPGGTVFQQRVWRALREIPPGETASYSEVAARIGAPRAARAVAQACAANPLAVAIPCHRVVGVGGALSGYRWGIERKRALQERERGA
jgi:AraC family transcriptional regulator, regulatory protein of adaptative response / methylated-DNA-[protein]-cysteine methyltransferase